MAWTHTCKTRSERREVNFSTLVLQIDSLHQKDVENMEHRYTEHEEDKVR